MKPYDPRNCKTIKSARYQYQDKKTTLKEWIVSYRAAPNPVTK